LPKILRYPTYRVEQANLGINREKKQIN